MVLTVMEPKDENSLSSPVVAGQLFIKGDAALK